MTEGEAELVLSQDLATVARIMAAEDTLPELRSLHAVATGLAERSDTPIDNLELDLELGLNGVVRFSATIEWFRTWSIDGFCTPDGQTVIIGERVLASRPRVVADPSNCDLGEDVDGLAETFEDWDLVGAQGSRSGLASKLWYDDGERRITADHDGRGRLVKMTLTGPWTGHWNLTFSYGERSAIAIPEANGVLPAIVELEAHLLAGESTRVYEVVASPQTPPRGDFAVQVRSMQFGMFGPSTFPSFDVAIDGSQVHDNLSFEYHDEDGDGKVTVGDKFFLRNLAPREGLHGVDAPSGAYLVDERAGADVNSGVMQVPMAPGFFVAGALLLGAWRTRKALHQDT